jgi:AcrR family transcriptional regulator
VTAVGNVPLRRDAAINRARLIAAAESVFATSGTATSMEDIASVAGVAPVTLYRRFPTKDDLIRAVLDSFFRRLLVLTEKALQAPPEQALAVFLATVGAEIARQQGLAHRLWGGLSPRELISELEARTADVLQAAKDAGVVHPSVTADDIAAGVRALRGVTETDDTAWRRHLAFMLAGFRAGPESLDVSEQAVPGHAA